MLVKYGESVTPFRKEQSGVTFFSGTKTRSAATGQKNDRWRYPRQNHSKWPLIHLARVWRDLSNVTRSNWNLFAASFPQPAEFPASGFLNGYQAFLRRNYWILFAHGFTAPLMLEPFQVATPPCPVQLFARRSGDQLFLDYIFDRYDSSVITEVFFSYPTSPGKNYQNSFTRWICEITNDPALEVLFGCLYNSFCTIDYRQFAPDGWRVMSWTDFYNLLVDLNFLYSTGIAPYSNSAALPLSEPSSQYWLTPFNAFTNACGWNGRGSSGRNGQTGNFSILKFQALYWNSDVYDLTRHRATEHRYNLNPLVTSIGGIVYYSEKKDGMAIRLIKDSTTLSNGESGTMSGNDGKIYPTICIRDKEYMAVNSCETKFRNGDIIPEVKLNSEWITQTTPAFCYYNNQQSNAFTGTDTSVNITDRYQGMFGILPQPGQWVFIKYLTFSKNSGELLESGYIRVQVQ